MKFIKSIISCSLSFFVLAGCDNGIPSNDGYNHKDYIVQQEQLTKLDGLKKMPEVIFFDYDGTIVDEGLNNEAARNAIKLYFEDEKEVNEILKIENTNNYDYFAYLYKHYDKETIRDISMLYGNEGTKQKIVFIDGIKDFLDYTKSKGIKNYVATQRAGRNTRKLLKIEKLDNHFQGVFGSYDCNNETKPSKGFIKCVKKRVKYHAQKDKCMMIGDRMTDVRTAIALGCNAVIVSNHDYDRINKEYKNKIGKSIFFSSYNILLEYFKKIK